MLNRYPKTLFLFASFLLIGTLTVAHGRWNDGGLLKSFRAWLGHPAVKTTIRVSHTDSGVVLRLTGVDTATVNRLQAALPERCRDLGSGRPASNSHDGRGQSTKNCSNEEKEKPDQNPKQDEADHN